MTRMLSEQQVVITQVYPLHKPANAKEIDSRGMKIVWQQLHSNSACEVQRGTTQHRSVIVLPAQQTITYQQSCLILTLVSKSVLRLDAEVVRGRVYCSSFVAGGCAALPNSL